MLEIEFIKYNSYNDFNSFNQEFYNSLYDGQHKNTQKITSGRLSRMIIDLENKKVSNA